LEGWGRSLGSDDAEGGQRGPLAGTQYLQQRGSLEQPLGGAYRTRLVVDVAQHDDQAGVVEHAKQVVRPDETADLAEDLVTLVGSGVGGQGQRHDSGAPALADQHAQLAQQHGPFADIGELSYGLGGLGPSRHRRHGKIEQTSSFF